MFILNNRARNLSRAPNVSFFLFLFLFFLYLYICLDTYGYYDDHDDGWPPPNERRWSAQGTAEYKERGRDEGRTPAKEGLETRQRRVSSPGMFFIYFFRVFSLLMIITRLYCTKYAMERSTRRRERAQTMPDASIGP
jgi:hypothetical protein